VIGAGVATCRGGAVARRVAPYSSFAPVYDAVIGREVFPLLRRAFEFLVRRHGLSFRSAADVGCGTGLFARYLRRRYDIPVVGVDLSPAMLARAAGGDPTGPGLTWMAGDLRALRLPSPVDLVTANFDTVNHLPTAADLTTAFGRIAANLRPGGHFTFDVVTTCRPLGGARFVLRRRRIDSASVLQQIRWNPLDKMLSAMLIQTRVNQAPEIEMHRERAFAVEEVDRALRAAGLVTRGVYDFTTLRPAARCAPRLLVLAQRPR
jgi:SAM-dependent methyltransferase